MLLLGIWFVRSLRILGRFQARRNSSCCNNCICVEGKSTLLGFFWSESVNSSRAWLSSAVAVPAAHEADGNVEEADGNGRPGFSSVSLVGDSLDKELAASGFTKKDQENL